MTSKTVHILAPIESGFPGPEHFEIRETPSVSCTADGEVRVQTKVMSADPYLRGQCKTMKPGEAMKGFIAGVVTESRNDKFKVGSLVGASALFSTDQVINPGQTVMWDLSNHITQDQISLGVGVLGMPGSTAYGGFIDILRPNPDETVWVSAAAGAVGSLVGQIAKIKGCRVIGSCGGPEKCELVKEKFGFDHCVDYKECNSAEELGAKLKEHVPEGIDMYFENVGGMHFKAAMATLRPRGRVAVCGSISHYNTKTGEAPLDEINIMQMIYSFQRVEGFMCMPWLSGKQGNFLEDMSKWVKDGKIQVEETFYDGIENWPVAFRALFEGTNKGKVVVRI